MILLNKLINNSLLNYTYGADRGSVKENNRNIYEDINSPKNDLIFAE